MSRPRKFGWMASFLAGGMAVAAPARRAPLAQVAPAQRKGAIEVARAEPEMFVDRVTRRTGGNIAILSGLMIIPLVAGTGLLSDGDLALGPRFRETVHLILHIDDAPRPSSRG